MVTVVMVAVGIAHPGEASCFMHKEKKGTEGFSHLPKVTQAVDFEPDI